MVIFKRFYSRHRHTQTTPFLMHRNQFILVLFGFLIMSGIFIFLQQYHYLGQTIEGERFTYVSEIRNQLVNYIEMKKDMQMAKLDLYDDSIQLIESTSFSSLPGHTSGSEKEEDTFFFLDQNGTCYTPEGKPVSLSNTDLAQRLIIKQEPVFSYMQINSTQEYWAYGKPIEEICLDGISIRAILSAQNIEAFTSNLGSELLESNCQTYIISRDGRILIYPSVGNIMGYNLFDSLIGLGASPDSVAEIKNHVSEGSSGQSFLDYQENRWILSYSGNIFDDWIVMVLMPMTITASDTYRMMNHIMYAMLFLVLSISGTLFFGVFLFYRREQAVQKEKMELVVMQRSAQVKNDFLSKMSHDIRTPLNAIIGLLKIVEGDSRDQPRIQTNLRKIEQSAKYLLAVLNDILDMSKIESGKMTLYQAPFCLKELFDSLETMNRTQAEAKGIHFETSIDGTCGQAYLGDQLRINQILMNLLSNAIKFTDRGGTVRLSLTVSPGPEKLDQLCFTVEDTGIGMSEAHVANLYKPFEQENGSIALNYAGSGLGLSIVKSLVELMGGTIRAESRKGVGSSFQVCLSLPRAENIRGSEPDMTSQPNFSLAGRKLLLVEDNDLNRMIAAELITTYCEMQADEVCDGAQAVERFAASAPEEYSAILMDVRMPVMDGLEATRNIRKLDHPRARTIPIIAMSANAFQEDAQQSLLAGMNLHLSKPLDIEELTAQLKLHIQKEDEICTLKHTHESS